MGGTYFHIPMDHTSLFSSVQSVISLSVFFFFFWFLFLFSFSFFLLPCFLFSLLLYLFFSPFFSSLFSFFPTFFLTFFLSFFFLSSFLSFFLSPFLAFFLSFYLLFLLFTNVVCPHLYTPPPPSPYLPCPVLPVSQSPGLKARVLVCSSWLLAGLFAVPMFFLCKETERGGAKQCSIVLHGIGQWRVSYG